MTTGEHPPEPPAGRPADPSATGPVDRPASGPADRLVSATADPSVSGAADPSVGGAAGPSVSVTSDEAAHLPAGGMALRDPAHRICARAIPYWTVESLIYFGLLMVAASVVYFVVLPERWWWATAIYVLLALGFLIDVGVKPRWRYAVHRWEVTPTAVYTRTGWLSREQRIAPLSRVQTVDSKRGALMRLFRLATITVTTASAAGPITIVALDEDEAERVVAELTEITGRIEGDAT